jgi:hypothetical protein
MFAYGSRAGRLFLITVGRCLQAEEGILLIHVIDPQQRPIPQVMPLLRVKRHMATIS